MDWKDSLKQFLDSNPDLPEGKEPVAEAEPQKKRRALEVMIDRKGRKGKTATIISGFDPDGADDAEAAGVAARLKTALGTGGSSRGGEILIQGERRDDVVRQLKAMGYSVKAR